MRLNENLINSIHRVNTQPKQDETLMTFAEYEENVIQTICYTLPDESCEHIEHLEERVEKEENHDDACSEYTMRVKTRDSLDSQFFNNFVQPKQERKKSLVPVPMLGS